MTIGVGQSAVSAVLGTSPSSTAGINTNVSGSTFVVLLCWTGNTPTLSDTINGSVSGNTWTQIGATLAGYAGGLAAIFYCQNGNGGTSHVFTSTWLGGPEQMFILPVEITGGDLTSVLDQISSPQWNDDTSSPFTANAITPAQANELVLAFCLSVSNSGTETPTFGAGFSQVQYAGDANHITGGIAKLVISAIASTNISYTLSGAGSTESATALVSFKAPAGGGSGGVLQAWQQQAQMGAMVCQ